jgi:Transposase DDE domain group 1
MVKVRTTEKKITPFGGLNFVIDEIEQAGIPQLIDSKLPKRHGGAKYKWSDALLSMIYGVFCGADRLEDMATLKNLMHNSCLNIPSPDNMSIIMRKNLTTANVSVNSKEMAHAFNLNEPMNGLLLDIALKLGTLKAGKSYVLDYDNTCLPCEKEDASFTYKKFRGYQPGVCFIGETPVYVEGMNGNNPAAFDQESTLKRSVKLLEDRGIKIRRFRADNASYQPEIIKMFDKEGCDFFLRATNSEDLYMGVTDIFDWKEARLADDTFEIGSFEYVPFKGKNTKSFRVVTTRRSADEPHHITGKNFVYRSIITNNTQLSDLDVVYTYNQRGAIEKNFDILNNDWNWSKLPFSFMGENTTFMLATAMGLVMYNHLVKIFASRVDFVQPTYRLKAFQFNMINVSAEWKGDTLLIHDRSRPWEKLAG